MLLPVGTRDEALAALWLVLPDLGTPDPRALLDEGLSGLDAGEHFTVTPRRALLLDLVSWRRNGFALRPEVYEFWQHREDRLHDRFRYRREAGGWTIERLAP